MTESEHSEEVERVVETHSQQQQPSGLGERPSQARYQETNAKICELMSETMFDRAKDEEPEQQQQRGTETSAADGPADAKQQQPGWKEAAGVDHLLWRAEWHSRKAVEALKALKAIIPEDEEDDMMASWLVGGAEVMSGETKSSDHDASLPDVSFQFSTSLWRHSDERRITRGGCGERCVNCSCRDIGPELLNL